MTGWKHWEGERGEHNGIRATPGKDQKHEDRERRLVRQTDKKREPRAVGGEAEGGLKERRRERENRRAN